MTGSYINPSLRGHFKWRGMSGMSCAIAGCESLSNDAEILSKNDLVSVSSSLKVLYPRSRFFRLERSFLIAALIS